jgi:hypothetical protein
VAYQNVWPLRERGRERREGKREEVERQGEG